MMNIKYRQSKQFWMFFETGIQITEVKKSIIADKRLFELKSI